MFQKMIPGVVDIVEEKNGWCVDLDDQIYMTSICCSAQECKIVDRI